MQRPFTSHTVSQRSKWFDTAQTNLILERRKMCRNFQMARSWKAWPPADTKDRPQSGTTGLEDLWTIPTRVGRSHDYATSFLFPFFAIFWRCLCRHWLPCGSSSVTSLPSFCFQFLSVPLPLPSHLSHSHSLTILSLSLSTRFPLTLLTPSTNLP